MTLGPFHTPRSKYGGTHVGRDRVMPHIKSYLRCGLGLPPVVMSASLVTPALPSFLHQVPRPAGRLGTHRESQLVQGRLGQPRQGRDEAHDPLI